MDITIKVKTDEAAPTHEKFPPVSSRHRTDPVAPSGWLNVRLRMKSGMMKIAITMSEIARFTSKRFIAFLRKS